MNKPFIDLKAQYQAYKIEIDQAIESVISSGQFIMGEPVHLLEKELELYTGAKNAITCGNGTDALQIALMSIGVGPGDEVITTPFTFVATAETIVLLGAKPVFVDIEKESYLIDANRIEAKITDKTKAIIPVSLYGQMADMDHINNIANDCSKKLGHKIYVIEDAAQSFGATYKGRKSCNASDIACTSFFPTKPLGCYGDGGAIFTSDCQLANIIRQIRVHGQDRRYHYARVGVNSRLDTLQAAILRVKLEHFDHELALRQQVAGNYNQQYHDTNIRPPKVMPGRTHVYGQYTIRVANREQFVATLQQENVPTAVHYPFPLNKQPAFIDYTSACPIAESACNEVVSLPMCLAYAKKNEPVIME